MVDIKTLAPVLSAVFGAIGSVVGYYYKKIHDFKKIGIILPARILRNDKKFYKKGKFRKIPGWEDKYISFKKRESPLLKALAKDARKDIPESILVVEEAGRGKTRTTLEVIRKLVKEDSVFKKALLIFLTSESDFNPDSILKRFFFFKYPFILLFFDDIDKIVPTLLKQSRKVGSVIDDFRKISKKTLSVCTCRKEPWYLAGLTRIDLSDFLSVRDDLDTHFKSLVTIPKLSEKDGKKLSKALKKKFDLSKFNGNAGDIVFDIPRKVKEYNLLHPHQQRILHAIKMCKIGKIDSPDKSIIGDYCVKFFNVEDWDYHFEELLKAEFFLLVSGSIILADSYMNTIIYDYPPATNPVLHRDLINLIDILESRGSTSELTSLASKFVDLQLFNQALRCYEILIELEPKNINHPINQATVLIDLGNIELAADKLQLAFDLNPKDFNVILNLGKLYLELEKYNEAEIYFIQAIKLKPKSIDALNGLGVVNLKIGKYLESLEYLQRALSLSNELADKQNESIILANLGHLFLKMNNFENAGEYYTQALTIIKELGDRRGEMIVLANLGNNYASGGDRNKAIEYFEKALLIAQELQDSWNKGFILQRLGMLLTDLGENKKALRYHMESTNYFLEVNDKLGQIRAMVCIGNALVKQEKNEAIEFYIRAIEFAFEVDLIYSAIEAFTIIQVRYKPEEVYLYQPNSVSQLIEYFIKYGDLMREFNKFDSASRIYKYALELVQSPEDKNYELLLKRVEEMDPSNWTL